jgi:hypothetical protein
MERCDGCRYWQSDEPIPNGPDFIDEMYGNCRRFPPAFHTPLNAMRLDSAYRKHNPLDMSWMLGFFPEVSADDWCGEFQPRSAAPDSTAAER